MADDRQGYELYFVLVHSGDPLPRNGDPNVQLELLRIAFGSRARELRSPQASSYASRMRILGCLGIVLFVGGITRLLINAP